MAGDPYRYFRVEARELVDALSEGVLALERGDRSPELLANVLRQAHTLKGAARVVRQTAIAEIAHAIEGILIGVRDGAALTSPHASALLHQLDAVSSKIRELDASAATAPAAVMPAADAPETRSTVERDAQETRSTVERDAPDTIRVDVAVVDRLSRALDEARLRLAAVRHEIAADRDRVDLARTIAELLAARPGDDRIPAHAARRARTLADELHESVRRAGRDLAVDVERVDVELAAARDDAHDLRLVAVRGVFPSLERTARDAAHGLGLDVEIETAGGDVRIDATMLGAVRDALVQIVRNAVAHGIEPRDARIAAGKPPVGRVRVAVERRGATIVFACSDDGRGIDVDAVRRAAIARGTPASELDDRDMFGLLATSGLTTSREITELAGRGIGLDVVRSTAARLKGHVALRSRPGRSTEIELAVPASIASLQALIVECEGTCAAIPLDAIADTARIADADLARSADGDTIVRGGAAIRFVPLDHAVLGTPLRRRRTWTAVVVRSGERRVAIGVDRLVGVTDVVVRSLPPTIDVDPIVAGVWIDHEGNPQVVLDPAGVIAARRRRAFAADVARPAPVLVIDDSLTTRMLEQSILESAGYDVELAVSAEDGLAKARERRYSLFVVDVEMPGMDGFELVATTRADPSLRDIPAILVTSRDAEDDRRRGERVGASAYIVKGEFDQQHLLDTIRRLVRP